MSLTSTEDPGPSTPTPRAVQKGTETWRRWYPIGEQGAPCVARAPALVPDTKDRLRYPPPSSFWNVDSGPRIPSVPQSPTTLSALQSDVSRRASGSDYPRGRGLWWAQPVRAPQALGGWSLSSEGAQLLLALISCGDFLTVLETPRRLRLWELCWLGNDGLPLPPNWSHIPSNPQETLFAECWTYGE